MSTNRSGLIGKEFQRFNYTISSEWIEEFQGITGEPVEIQSEGPKTVPYTMLSVITLNICQQRWFDLAEALEASWTEDTLMLGEQTYRCSDPLLADVPYEVSNKIVQVEQKEGKVPFEIITFETVFHDPKGEVVYQGTNTYIVVD